MTVHAIRIAGDPVLHHPTREITEFDEKLRVLTDDMFETMYEAEGVGLAANQIGLDLRVFVYDCPDDEGVRHKGVVVNPKLETSAIPETMPDPDDDWEGCLSAPGESYPTGRASWAKVTGSDIEGNPIEVEGTGYFARCLQHETDHLDGYIYLDRLVGRHARAAKKMLKSNKWGVPGLSWLPPRTPEDDGAVI
ncbi:MULTISPECIES: peptide deformylase [unclassified Amycolatopsis]|uniref:peptide deformylase n=1 Tax=unclassified Amycolatopsis TaxID=2618356 RepID=UPI001FF4B170|nr:MULTISPECIES: peptide deformylase [unclassified Amycolatopsis]UOZ08182.1 peptide deformylase [Amycolatopsis sp. WQ 127309]WSJ74445.1 peptide deformylase [Amycolatopsis sp. NBC_01307]WSK81905.1 peptide deformylase [Amycolatopsis sp. NBC_01286]